MQSLTIVKNLLYRQSNELFESDIIGYVRSECVKLRVRWGRIEAYGGGDVYTIILIRKQAFPGMRSTSVGELGRTVER